MKTAALLVSIILFSGFEMGMKNMPNTPGPGIKVIKRWDLPVELTEISGLASMGHERFACIQDELGYIYIYNTGTSKLEKEIPFAGFGDYEGIALVNDTAWVIRSDGRLYEINNIKLDKPSVKEYKTQLTVNQNIEGLCYDKKHNRLLLAIKNEEYRNSKYKGIYAFDLATKTMPVEPVFKLDMENELIGAALKKKNAGIMPSEIAIHPLSSEMYITDGANSKLIITDSLGTIKKIYQLDLSEFPQPEGITILPDGEMFISNEGRKGPGTILKVETIKE